MQYPAVVVALEKMLIIGCLPVASVMQTWGITMGMGPENAPYYLTAVICALYYMFVRPMPSSFQSSLSRSETSGVGGSRTARRGHPAASSLQGAADGFAAFTLMTLLPAGMYAAAHSSQLTNQWTHLWSLLLLLSGPVLFAVAIEDGTWWLGRSAAADALRSTVGLLALASFLAGIEGRIIFHSFGQYIRLAAPWSYVAITLGLYGMGALAVLHRSGALGEEAAGLALGPVLMLSSSVGSLVMGLPAYVIPAPLIASAGLALFNESRTLRDYTVFIVGALGTAGWFIWKHFWHLDVHLDGMPLRTLCVLLAIGMVPAFCLPGLILSGSRGKVVTLFLLVQAGLLCVAEERLFAGDHSALTYNLHPMFPSALVVATSAVGLAAVRKLAALQIVGEVGAYLLQCVFGAKLAMLVVPEARLMVPMLGLALATTPPILVHIEKEGDTRAPRRLPPWQGLGLTFSVVAATAAARFAIFDILKLVYNRRPSEALAAGSLLIVASLGCVPLVSRYYRTSAQAKRLVLLTATLGLLLAVLRPPLPITGGAKCPHLPFGLCPRLWNEAHVPEHEQDDVSIYGDGLRRREHWPLWMLLGAAFAGTIAATSTAPALQAAPLRLLQAAISAALVGAYMGQEFFPGMPLVQSTVLVSALLVATIVVLLNVPTRGAAIILVFSGLLWLGCLPAAVFAQAVSPLPALPPESHRLHPDLAQGAEIDSERKEAVRSAVMASFAVEALLLAFSLKLRVAGATAFGSKESRSRAGLSGGGPPVDYIDRAAEFLGQCMPAHAIPRGVVSFGVAGSSMQRLESEGLAWMPTACNLVTLLCFGLCLNLNVIFTGGNHWGVLLLAPILLLLCQDPILCWRLTDQRRYFPPVLAAFLLLGISILWELQAEVGRFGGALGTEGWYLLRNGGGLLACLPMQIEFLRFLWTSRRVAPGRALVPGAIAGIGVFVADMEAVRLLAGLTLTCVVVLFGAAQHNRTAGRKLI